MTFRPSTRPGAGLVNGIEAGVSAIPVEARPFQGGRAGVVSRTLANSVDFAVVTLIMVCGYGGVAAFRFLLHSRSFTFPTPPFGLLLTIGAVVMMGYLTFSWVTTGRTYGDHLLGLRVLGAGGRPLGITIALARAVFCVVFPLGLFWVTFSGKNRSVQDVVLRTSVIYDWAKELPGRSG